MWPPQYLAMNQHDQKMIMCALVGVCVCETFSTFYMQTNHLPWNSTNKVNMIQFKLVSQIEKSVNKTTNKWNILKFGWKKLREKYAILLNWNGSRATDKDFFQIFEIEICSIILHLSIFLDISSALETLHFSWNFCNFHYPEKLFHIIFVPFSVHFPIYPDHCHSAI